MQTYNIHVLHSTLCYVDVLYEPKTEWETGSWNRILKLETELKENLMTVKIAIITVMYLQNVGLFFCAMFGFIG